MRTPTQLPFLLGTALATSVLNAPAQLTPVSQSRSIAADALAEMIGGSDTESDSASALGFGPFIAEVDALAITISGLQDVVIAQGVARQNSIIGSSSVSVSGGASTSVTLLPISDGRGYASAESLFDLEFTVPFQSTFSLSGEVDTLAIITGGASIPFLSNDVFLRDLDNDILLFQTLTNDELLSWDAILDPGLYRLYASASVLTDQLADLSVVRTASGISAFEFNFQVATIPIPEPGTVMGAIGLSALCGWTWWQRRRRTA